MGIDPVRTRPLGRTGLALTQLGLGSAPLGELFVKVSEDDAMETLAGAWRAGLRYYDTSPWYGRGQAEHRVGRFLRHQHRGEFVLSTKVGRVLQRPARPDAFDFGFWAGGLPFDAVFDYSYDGIMRSFEDSLQRLGINSIDLLLIHDLDMWHQQTETKVATHLGELATGGWRALAQLRDQGAIKGIGAGINELGMIPRFLDLVPLDFFLVALRYTLLDQRSIETELPLCTKHGCSIVIGGVFNSGILASGAVKGAKYDYADAPSDVMERVRQIEAVCRRHSVPLPAAALQFPLGHPLVASVIPGAITAQQVEANIAALRHPIPADLWTELKAERLIHPDAPIPTSDPT